MDMLKRQEPKVKAQLTISCGCSFTPRTQREALEHAEETGHILTVHGLIGRVERLHGASLVEFRAKRAAAGAGGNNAPQQ